MPKIDLNCDGIAEVDESLVLLAFSGSVMIEAEERKGLRVASEVFADCAYESDGSLLQGSSRKP